MPSQAVLLHLAFCVSSRGPGHHWHSLLTALRGRVVRPAARCSLALVYPIAYCPVTLLARLLTLRLVHHYVELVHNIEFIAPGSYGRATLTFAIKAALLMI